MKNLNLSLKICRNRIRKDAKFEFANTPNLNLQICKIKIYK